MNLPLTRSADIAVDVVNLQQHQLQFTSGLSKLRATLDAVLRELVLARDRAAIDPVEALARLPAVDFIPRGRDRPGAAPLRRRGPTTARGGPLPKPQPEDAD